MTVLLILFGGAVALEFLVHICGKARRTRRVVAAAALITGCFAAGALAMWRPNVFSGLIALFSLYRAFNMIRVVEERMHEVYLRRATRRTSIMLVFFQLLIAVGWILWNTYATTGYVTWAVIAGLQTVVAFGLLMSAARNLKRTIWPLQDANYSDKELPTVTIAIPARNETEDLEQCLQSVIASDYPKLEVIVLDDCSQLKRTPQIIKEFAHAGVRFVQGHEPRDTWLPKNQAYDRLLNEATGQYILFCGVDVRFEAHSIRQAISVMLARHKKMLSILPRRQSDAYGQISLIQAMRYWWELVPPRRMFNRPAVISSCWITEAGALKKAGGFAAVARSITPEAHFARHLAKADEYSFLRSTGALGIQSNKHVSSQRDTAIRMRYPQLHRRPEQVAAVTILEFVFLLLPFIIAIAGFWISVGPVAHVCAIVASLMLIISYELVVLSTKVNNWIFGVAGQPLAVLVDIYLVHYSMWKYEFSTVEWKGRNVCIPVMHVIPNLPKDN